MELKGRNIKLTIDGVEVPVCNIESISLRSDTPIINGVVPPQIEQTLYKFRAYSQGFDEVVLEMIQFTGLPPVMETVIYPWTSLETNLKMPNLKLPRKGESTIRSREYLMSVNLLTSHDLVKELQAKLIDYSALSDAPDRIEAVPSVYIDKAPVMHALKKEIQAIHAKLGENIKKL